METDYASISINIDVNIIDDDGSAWHPAEVLTNHLTITEAGIAALARANNA